MLVGPTEVEFSPTLARSERHAILSKLKKLPPLHKPSYSRIPKPMTDKEAGRVVLPNIPFSGWNWRKGNAPKGCVPFTPDPNDVDLAPRVQERYLLAMGETKNGRRWSCGCKREDDYWDNFIPCDRHRLPLQDFDPEA